MTLTEAIEFGMPCVNLAQDAEWCEVALETMKKYQELIPDNATNGDVLKAIFPKATQTVSEPTMWFEVDGYAYEFSYKWWNAPYESKAESEDKE